MNFKKLLSIVLAVVMVIGMMPMTVFAVGLPTKADLEIATVDDLFAFAAAVNGGDNFAGKKVQLTNDLDLAGIEWQPIGGSSVYFAGEFDGNGKTISNLTNTQDVARKGLFGLVEDCYIHDLTLKNVKFSGNASGMRVGALAGNLNNPNWNGTGCIIENVAVDGLDYDLNDTDGLIGGLIGYAWNSHIVGCTVKNADMNISSTGNSAVGTMIGYGRGVTDNCYVEDFPTYGSKIDSAYVNADGAVQNYVDCNVDGAAINLSGTVSFGGFFGADTYNHWRNVFVNCDVTGLEVICAEGDGVYTVGGFMSAQAGGYSAEAIKDCDVVGTITSYGTNTASTFAGFVGGEWGRTGGATNCTADVDITAVAGNVAGFCGSIGQYNNSMNYSFNGCTASGDVKTEEGVAGGFVAAASGDNLNVSLNNNTVAGTAEGTTTGNLVGNLASETGLVITDGITVPENNLPLVGGGHPELCVQMNKAGYAAFCNGEYYTTLAEAIAAATNGATILIFDGTHTMPGSVANKEITIKGGQDAVIEMLTAVNASGSTITFDGVTAKFDNDNYEGLQHAAKVVYNNCTLIGTQFLYAPVVSFTDCTFEMYDANTEYSVWTYGASDVTFANCTFNTNGKAVLVYTEGTHKADIKLNNCHFYSHENGKHNNTKAAVEVGESANGAKGTYTLNFTNCTADAYFIANKSTSNLWGNKNEMAVTGLGVVIDGVDVRLMDKYETLQEAIDAAQPGDTITLLKDITESGIEVADDDNVIIDLNGYTLTGDILSEGTLTVKNGSIISNQFVSAIESYGENAVLTLEDVNVTSERHAVRIEGGKATIISGTYTATGRPGQAESVHAVNAGGAFATEVTIQGGTFNGIKYNGNAENPDSGAAVNAQNNAAVTIKGGNFAYGQNNTLATSGTGKIVVTGGTYDQDPSAYVAEGYKAGKFGQVWTVVETAERTFVVTTDEPTYVYGDTVTVTVTLEGTGIAGAEWTLLYNDDLFELTSGSVNGKKFAVGQDVFADNEMLATYTFKVIAQTKDEITDTFSVTNVKAQTRDEAIVNIRPECLIKAAEVTISAPAYEVVVGTGDFIASKKLVLVYTNSNDICFTYAGATMFDVSTKYSKTGYAKTYAIVVDAIVGGDNSAYAANVDFSYGNVGSEFVIAYDKENPNKDLNGSGDVDMGDVIVVYGVYNGYANYYENFMAAVLNADVDADGDVDADDTRVFVQAYNDAL